MVNDPKFTVQLLDKIGGPLSAAIDQVAVESEAGQVESAQIMAQLLGRATHMSTALFNALDIKEEVEQADTTRLALAGIAAPLIADAYVQQKQVPSEETIQNIEKSLEAVISFGENFTAAGSENSRLQTIDHDNVLFDESQPSMVILQAMVPVINAVEEFAFGQSARKLVQDIAAKLNTYAGEMAQKTGTANKVKELMIFKTLAALYTACHRVETQRASAGGDEARGELSLDPVWAAFDVKLGMVEALMGLDSEAASSGASSMAPAVEKVVEQPQQQPAAAPEAVKEVPAQSSGTAGPMGFFKKGDDAASSEAVNTPEQAPVVTYANSESAQPTGPMGFFKPGAKKTEE